MNFGDIRDAIGDAWSFAWPPILLIFLCYHFSRYLNATGTLRALAKLMASTKAYGSKINSLREVLEPYGLTKLVPIISGVLVLIFLFLINGPIMEIGRQMPPYLSYSPEMIAVRGNPDKALLVLIRKFPTAEQDDQLYYDARATYPPKNDQRGAFNHQLDGIIKLLIVSTIVLLVINFRRTSRKNRIIARFLLLIAGLVICWSVNFVYTLRNVEQSIYAEWRDIRLQALKDADKFLEKPPTAAEASRIYSLKMQLPAHVRWWRLSGFGYDDLNWIARNIFQIDPSARSNQLPDD